MRISELELLDRSENLYLRQLTEPRDNTLRIVVDQAVALKPGSFTGTLPGLSEVLKGAQSIEVTEQCRAFEILWDRYVAYLVTEECVGGCGKYDDEIFMGNRFRVYTKSHFLEHLARDTGGHSDQPINHYKLICLDHVIDVASYNSPDIRLVPVVPTT